MDVKELFYDISKITMYGGAAITGLRVGEVLDGKPINLEGLVFGLALTAASVLYQNAHEETEKLILPYRDGNSIIT